MAQKIQYLLIDDIDGGDAEETVEFGIDGVEYVIDLSSKNAKTLRDSLAPYVAESRRAPRPKRGSRRSGAAANGAAPAKIREWASVNGYEVSERGRVSTEIREAYAAAH